MQRPSIAAHASTFRRSAAALAAAALAMPATAAFTTVDLSSVVYTNVDRGTTTYPLGLSTGNQGTAIPFDVSPYPADGAGAGFWIGMGTGSSVTVAVNAPGQASFYALLNNYFGTPGADEYDVTITATNGDTVSYQSIGGVDTRDFNSNIFTNTIAHTTKPWFDNGVGQRLDLREFSLPASFLDETVATFSIVQMNPTDQALFSGLTFSTLAIPSAVPEPAEWALLLLGLVTVAACTRRPAAVTAGRSATPAATAA